jgi:hypothetical protein
MLGWLLTRIGSAPLIALALLSIVPSAVVFLLGATQFEKDSTVVRPRLQLLATAVVASMGALTGPVRDCSVRVEVYALAAFFVLCAIHTAQSTRRFAAILTGALLGCAAATNPVVAVQGVGVALLLYTRPGRLRNAVMVVSSAVLVAIVCYGYAAAAVSREASTLVWGAPRDATSWMSLIFARDFAQNISLSLGQTTRNMVAFCGLLLRSGCGEWLLLGLLGLALKNDDKRVDRWFWPAVIATTVGLLMVAANGEYLENNPDYGGYLLVACGLCTRGLVRLCLMREFSRFVSAVSISILLAITVTITWKHGRSAGTTRAIATHTLQHAPVRSIAVLASDHVLFAALYLQHVERMRTDVVIINPGWASSRWAWRWIQAQDPSLRVDLRPGLGRAQRLANTLQNRGDRAAVAETPLYLSSTQGHTQGVCPRGMLWVTHEGCDATTRSTRSTAEWLSGLRHRADSRRDVWGQRMIRYTAALFADGVRASGCSGVARRIYAAGLGQSSSATGVNCGFVAATTEDPPNILTITDAELLARIEATQRDGARDVR